MPDLRESLDLDNTGVGLLLLAIAVGSLVALPTTGALVARHGAGLVVRCGAALVAVGLLVATTGAGPLGSVPVAATGLLLYGAGVGVWDVAMNVEGAEVERRLGRSVMPRLHAAFSLGTVLGALVGVLVVRLDVATAVHLPVAAALVVPAVVVATAGFLPVEPVVGGSGAARAWLEPRTVLIGLMVLTFAVAEGSANDWLAIALVDGHDAARWLGVAGYAGFVSAMTLGRLAGPLVLDRWGPAPTLWGSAALTAAGVLLVVHGSGPLVALGCLVWGSGWPSGSRSG